MPRVESYFSRCASVAVSVRSLAATNSMFGLCNPARTTFLPIRPKPLIPTLMDIDDFSLANCHNLLDLGEMIQVVAAHGFDDGLKRHRAALRVADGPRERFRRQGGDQSGVEIANRY